LSIAQKLEAEPKEDFKVQREIFDESSIPEHFNAFSFSSTQDIPAIAHHSMRDNNDRTTKYFCSLRIFETHCENTRAHCR